MQQVRVETYVDVVGEILPDALDSIHDSLSAKHSWVPTSRATRVNFLGEGRQLSNLRGESVSGRALLSDWRTMSLTVILRSKISP